MFRLLLCWIYHAWNEQSYRICSPFFLSLVPNVTYRSLILYSLRGFDCAKGSDGPIPSLTLICSPSRTRFRLPTFWFAISAINYSKQRIKKNDTLGNERWKIGYKKILTVSFSLLRVINISVDFLSEFSL